MRALPHRLGIALVLVAWVFLGPIAMAFDSCPGMMVMCEGPCGALSYVGSTPTTVGLVHSIIMRVSPRSDHPPAVLVDPADPPPKHLRLSA